MAEKLKCPSCFKEYAVKANGEIRKHPCYAGAPLDVAADAGASPLELLDIAADVSDPAPTVDETTTQGDDVDGKGPWFGAMYDGWCSVNECQIFEGDRIRADGEGGYECEDCGDSQEPEELMVGPYVAAGEEPIVFRSDAQRADWQAQASAAARRHTAARGAAADAEVAAEQFLDPAPAVPRTRANQGVPLYVTAEQFLDPAPASRGVANLENTAQYVDQYSRPASAMTAEQFLDPAPSLAAQEYNDTLPTAEQFLDPAATEDVQPVMSVSGQPKRVRRDHMKRYAVVLPGETELERFKSSGNPVGRTRVTTFIKEASSTIKLGEWKARNVVIGASRRRDLLLKAQGLTHEDDRDRLNAIAAELEEAAGAKVGSDLGTYLHEFTEYMDAGLKTPDDAPEEFRGSLWRYEQALLDAGLEPIRSLIERTTIIREYGWVCGTFDRIFYHRPSGQYVIGDLKTAKTMDYGRNEVEAQLWAYAHGVNQNGIYDWNTDTWDTDWLATAEFGGEDEVGRVSESVGVVIHMPVQGKLEGTVQLLWADLEAGARHAELCQAVRSQPKGKMRPWGDGPSPARAAAGIIDWSKIDPTPWEMLFSQVRTGEEASALWRRAKNAGVDRMELQRLIGIAQTALRQLGVRG